MLRSCVGIQPVCETIADCHHMTARPPGGFQDCDVVPALLELVGAAESRNPASSHDDFLWPPGLSIGGEGRKKGSACHFQYVASVNVF